MAERITFSRLREALDLDEAEEELVEGAGSSRSPTVHKAEVLSQLYTAHHLQQAMEVLDGASVHLQVAIRESTSNVIESNKELAEESRRYARALNWLTGVLAVATLILAGATIALV